MSPSDLYFVGKKFWNLFHLQPMRDQKVIKILYNSPRTQLTWTFKSWCLFIYWYRVLILMILCLGWTSILHWCSIRWERSFRTFKKPPFRGFWDTKC